MKAWGWISMKRSFGDALKNAFEETTMKNMPIDQFWSFKWRNKVQNQNLHEKLSKINPFSNFNFWSKVTAKVKVNKGQSQRLGRLVNDLHSLGRFWVFQVSHGSSCRVADVILMMWHWRGLGLTWLGLAWLLMMSLDDVRRMLT